MTITKRINAIDSFRGIVMISMVIVNFIRDIPWIPAFLKHAPIGEVTFVDIIAPAFIFMMGLTARRVFNMRMEKHGLKTAVGHAARRSLALIGIETLFYLYVFLVSGYRETVVWNTLSVIGFVGFVSLPLMNRPAWIKLLTGCILITVHQFFVTKRFGASIYTAGGGTWSLAGWTAVLVLGLFMADLFFKEKQQRCRQLIYPAAAMLMLAAGIISGRWFPFMRRGMSLSLCFLSVGVSSLFFYLVFLVEKRVPLGFFAVWGRNPLLIFIVSIMFMPFNIKYKYLPLFQEPNLLMFLYFAGYMALLQSIVWVLDRRKIYLKL